MKPQSHSNKVALEFICPNCFYLAKEIPFCDVCKTAIPNSAKVVAPTPRKNNIALQMKAKKNRELVFERDGYKCLKCGSTHKLTIDHIIPRSKGGKNHPTNYQTLCFSCNLEKGIEIKSYVKG